MGSIEIETELPAGAWDSHVHVVDEDKFPLHQSHPYRPKKATLDDLLAHAAHCHISHVCLIAFSVYSTDNRCILDALKRLNGKGRAVVAIDPETVSDEELQEMHGIGVRGVRLNLHTTSQKPTRQALAKVLWQYANKIRPFGWVLQIYLSMEQIALISEDLRTLRVPIVIDHLGTPAESKHPQEQEGYSEFMALLEKNIVYVKLSGIYRFPNLPELGTYIREILRIAPTQVVWASDWPHSGGVGANPGGDRTKVQDYRKIDDSAFIVECKKWCDGDETLVRKIWVENPRRLWQYDSED